MIVRHGEKERQQLLHDFVMTVYDEAQLAADSGSDYYYFVNYKTRFEKLNAYMDEAMTRLRRLFPNYTIYTTFIDRDSTEFVEYEIMDRRDLYDIPENYVQTLVVDWSSSKN